MRCLLAVALVVLAVCAPVAQAAGKSYVLSLIHI